jgi:hypothetical protein
MDEIHELEKTKWTMGLTLALSSLLSFLGLLGCVKGVSEFTEELVNHYRTARKYQATHISAAEVEELRNTFESQYHQLQTLLFGFDTNEDSCFSIR